MKNRISASSKSTVEVVRCPGDLSASHMVSMKTKFRRLMNRNHKYLLIDLRQANHAELAGLGILVDRIKQVRSAKGDIRLFNMQPEVMETFKMVGLNQVIETYDNEEEARQSFQAA